MGDDNLQIFSSNTSFEASMFMFQWNNRQGSVIHKWTSPKSTSSSTFWLLHEAEVVQTTTALNLEFVPCLTDEL